MSDSNKNDESATLKKPVLRTQPSSYFNFNKRDISNFNIIGKIGQGSFGRVFLVSSKKSKNLYALKVIKKDLLVADRDILSIKRERFLLRSLKKNTFIVTLMHTFQDEVNLYFQMEYLNGGNIYDLMKRKLGFSEYDFLFYISHIIVAISKLHEENIIYRDLKPENVMISHTDQIVKVTLQLHEANIFRQ